MVSKACQQVEKHLLSHACWCDVSQTMKHAIDEDNFGQSSNKSLFRPMIESKFEWSTNSFHDDDE